MKKTFYIKAAARLFAAEDENQKDVKDLATSTLQKIADDEQDKRSKQAQKELEHRGVGSDSKSSGGSKAAKVGLGMGGAGAAGGA